VEVEIETWKKLAKLKAEWNLKSLDEVVSKLLKECGSI